MCIWIQRVVFLLNLHVLHGWPPVTRTAAVCIMHVCYLIWTRCAYVQCAHRRPVTIGFLEIVLRMYAERDARRHIGYLQQQAAAETLTDTRLLKLQQLTNASELSF